MARSAPRAPRLASPAARAATARAAAAQAPEITATRAATGAACHALPAGPGPGAAGLGRGAASESALAPLLGASAADAETVANPPERVAIQLPRSQDEHIARVAFHHRAGLRVGNGEFGAALDIPFFVRMQQRPDLQRVLAALFQQSGGVSR